MPKWNRIATALAVQDGDIDVVFNIEIAPEADEMETNGLAYYQTNIFSTLTTQTNLPASLLTVSCRCGAAVSILIPCP